ncbi:COG3014 family protein [Shewanella sedimentimangrovi]|uniref:Lipoprotein n=1 Tax=Shewanella sedimentimangrovi TaxID=2814293 RepID=A0ABX7R298_9GAMM|nr:hypothetical protein [Shewanella sedimentimangrovi]QSX37198.1 hypothetical protein JYB85_18455 [Shewanella sedimentimangrovi]
MNKTLAATVLALTVSGCAITERNSQGKLDNNLLKGDTVGAITLAKEKAGLDETTSKLADQLWGMQAGSLLRMNKDYAESNKYFDSIEDVMYMEDTENVLESTGELIGSTLTNDAMLDYEQTYYDAVMVNTYKALNFISIGDLANARIEWNRSDERQKRAADYFASKINKQKESLAKEDAANADNIKKSLTESEKLLADHHITETEWSAYDGYINPFSTFMHGLFFMLNAQDSSDIGKAVDSLNRVASITKTKVSSDTLKLAEKLQSGSSHVADLKKVWVVFENGQATKKEELRVDLPLFLVSDNVAYTGIALPKLKAFPAPYASVKVGAVETEVVGDMDKIIQAEFKEAFPLILSKEISRAVIKTVAQKQIKDRNPLLGFGAGLLQAATTQADTRTWSLLPKNFQAAMVDTPEQGKLTLSLGEPAASIDVDVPTDKNAIVYIKAATANASPIIEVISL